LPQGGRRRRITSDIEVCYKMLTRSVKDNLRLSCTDVLARRDVIGL